MLSNDEIKQWMKKAGVTRQQLAEKFGVDKRTVDNWFYKGFSPSQLTMIKLLMDEQRAKVANLTEISTRTLITLNVPDEVMPEIQAAAKTGGMSLEEYVHSCITYFADHPDMFGELERHLMDRHGDLQPLPGAVDTTLGTIRGLGDASGIDSPTAN